VTLAGPRETRVALPLRSVRLAGTLIGLPAVTTGWKTSALCQRRDDARPGQWHGTGGPPTALTCWSRVALRDRTAAQVIACAAVAFAPSSPSAKTSRRTSLTFVLLQHKFLH
jgi:hypothetical protein